MQNGRPRQDGAIGRADRRAPRTSADESATLSPSQLLEFTRDFRSTPLGCTHPRDHHDIPRGDFRVVSPIPVSDPPLHVVPRHSVANLTTHCETQSRSRLLEARGSYQDEIAAGMAPSSALNPSKILRVAQAGLPPEALGVLSWVGEVFGHRCPRRGMTVAAGPAYLDGTLTASR